MVNFKDIPRPKFGTLTALQSARIAAKYPNVPTQTVAGYILPNDPGAMKAGACAIANKLTLDLQDKKITMDQYKRCMTALKPE